MERIFLTHSPNTRYPVIAAAKSADRFSSRNPWTQRGVFQNRRFFCFHAPIGLHGGTLRSCRCSKGRSANPHVALFVFSRTQTGRNHNLGGLTMSTPQPYSIPTESPAYDEDAQIRSMIHKTPTGYIVDRDEDGLAYDLFSDAVTVAATILTEDLVERCHQGEVRS